MQENKFSFFIFRIALMRKNRSKFFFYFSKARNRDKEKTGNNSGKESKPTADRKVSTKKHKRRILRLDSLL
jgi:hypothetical protein